MKILGIGNAIVDILSRCDDKLLEALNLEKGTMQLVDTVRSQEIYQHVGPSIEISGGSVANSCALMGQLGAEVGFLGNINDDMFGKIFHHDLTSLGVNNITHPKTQSEPTASSIVLVTPDAQRTMCTHLGCAGLIDHKVTDEDLENVGLLYLEGYLFDSPSALDVMKDCIEKVKAQGGKIALSLSDPFCVERHHDAFWDLISSKDHGVDILFANEVETYSLFNIDAKNPELLKKCETMSILLFSTHGSEGIHIFSTSGYAHVPAYPVAEVLDTTGAGDAFAGGVLTGISQNQNPVSAAKLGAYCASAVIGQLGARIQENIHQAAREKGLL